MKATLKKLMNSRKWLTMFTTTITAVLILVLTHYMGDEAAQILSQKIAGMIVASAAVFAGAQGVADHGDATYSKSGIIKLTNLKQE